MRQTILSVVLDVDPQSARHLSDLIEAFKRQQEEAGVETYGRLKDGVPSLHFLSMSIFPGAHYDPIFVIEANFDGSPDAFWGQMEATLADLLRPMLRCCKRPADSDGLAYDAVTKPDLRVPVVAYLARRTLRPSVFHQGNRGLERDRILRERDLFLAIRDELAQASPTAPNPYRAIPAEQIHVRLRNAMVRSFPWLAEPAPPRISWIERAADFCRLLAFLFATFLCLSIPGMAVAPVTPAWRFAVLTALPGRTGGDRPVGHAPRPGRRRRADPFRRPDPGQPVGEEQADVVRTPGHPGCRPAARRGALCRRCHRDRVDLHDADHGIELWRLPYGRRRGSSCWDWQASPSRRRPSSCGCAGSSGAIRPTMSRRSMTGLLREMARREDWIAQNHMGSVCPRQAGCPALRSSSARAILDMGLLTQGDRDGRLSRQHADRSLRPLGVHQQRQSPDVLQQLRSQLGELPGRLHRKGARRTHACLGQRRRLPADPLSGARRRQPRAQVQGVGPSLDGGKPVLVQRLS